MNILTEITILAIALYGGITYIGNDRRVAVAAQCQLDGVWQSFADGQNIGQ